MVEANSAVALMGNHEFNALAYHTPDGKNSYLRPHTSIKTGQHSATLAQFYYHQDVLKSCLKWMSQLPLTFATDEIRCVHACWDNRHIAELNKIVEKGLTPELLQKATNKNHEYRVLFEEVLKGKEIDLPNGQSFLDKDGHRRDKVRLQWWLDPHTLTYHQYSISDLPDSDVLSAMVEKVSNPLVYHSDEIPVFFGHYWLRGRLYLMRDNVCCLDFSVAKEGYLAGYRWEGEKRLSQEHFVYV